MPSDAAAGVFTTRHRPSTRRGQGATTEARRAAAARLTWGLIHQARAAFQDDQAALATIDGESLETIHSRGVPSSAHPSHHAALDALHRTLGLFADLPEVATQRQAPGTAWPASIRHRLAETRIELAIIRGAAWLPDMPPPTAPHHVIRREQARRRLYAVTPLGCRNLANTRVLAMQQRGVLPNAAMERVTQELATGAWRP